MSVFVCVPFFVCVPKNWVIDLQWVCLCVCPKHTLLIVIIALSVECESTVPSK